MAVLKGYINASSAWLEEQLKPMTDKLAYLAKNAPSLVKRGTRSGDLIDEDIAMVLGITNEVVQDVPALCRKKDYTRALALLESALDNLNSLPKKAWGRLPATNAITQAMECIKQDQASGM